MLNANIESFIEELGLNFEKEEYIDENVKLLTDKNGEKLYITNKYNTITCVATRLEETYELRQTLVDGQSKTSWVKVN